MHKIHEGEIPLEDLSAGMQASVLSIGAKDDKMLLLKKVDTDEEISEVYRLRYKVYCQEKKFEEEDHYPDKHEVDEYDAYSVHFLARQDEHIVGTVRLILNNPIGFPTERHCKLNFSIDERKKQRTAEISRFIICKSAVKSTRCSRKDIVLGLFREMYREGNRLGIKYVYATMGKGLQKLLLNCGIIFLQAGPEVNFRGIRAPYFTWVKNIEDGLFVKDINLFRYVTSLDNVPLPVTESA